MSIFEFADQLGFNPPIDFESESLSELWDGYVDFFKALERFGVGTLKDINVEEGIPLEEVVIKGRIIKTAFDYKKVIDPNKSRVPNWEFGKIAYPGYILVNKKIDYLSDRKLFFNYDGIQERPTFGLTFSIYKPYNTDSNVGTITNPNISHLKENAALQVQALGFKGVLIILEGLDNGTADQKYVAAGYKLVANVVEQVVRGGISLPISEVNSILAHLNDRVLQYMSTEVLEIVWSRLLNINNLTNIYETILLHVLEGLSNKPNFNATTFLKRLVSNTINGETEFQRIYNKMNDWGGPNNFSKLILRLLLIWKDSNFINPENPEFKNFDRPVNLAYKQKKILGFRVDDYDFEFTKQGNIIAEIEPSVRLPNNPIGSIIADEIFQIEEHYHSLFPMTLTELDETENEELKLETTVPVPAFYLKAFDDKGAWENFEKGVWLAVDIITTATGVGNLLKIRHLLKLKTAYAYLKLAFGVIEVASGILSIALSFVDKCEDKTFCNKLRQYLFWFEICTLGADALTTRILRIQAQEAKNALELYRKRVKNSKKKEDLDRLEGHLDEVARLDNIGRNLDSIRLNKFSLNDWINRLERVGARVRFAETSKKMKRYFKEEKVGASFDPFEVPPTVWIRKDATDLELFHEAMHFEDFLRRGKLNYIRGEKREVLPFGNLSQIPERDQLISSYIKEKYVLDKILEEQRNWIDEFGKGRFSEQEIKFSTDYFNSFVEKIEDQGVDINSIK